MRCYGVVPVWGLALFFAMSAGGQSATVHHRFRFFVEPQLAAPFTRAELGARLAMYVDDLNTIFAKNTVRRFDFNPNDVTVTTDLDRLHGYYPGELPETDYEVWALAKYTPNFYSYGGWGSFATNGAGVAADMYWAAIYSRDALTNAPAGDWQLRNYWWQLLAMAYALEQVFGAGGGSYYSVSTMTDTTGVEPLHSVHFDYWTPGNDAYWSQHPDYWSDPLLNFVLHLTHAETLRRVRFAEVSGAMISAGYRRAFPVNRYLPDLSATRVWLFSGGPENPIVNARVRVWLVSQRTDVAQEIFSGRTDASGRVQFAWAGEPNNEANTILIKAYPPTGEARARWYTLYEAQEQKVLFGRNELNIYMNMARNSAPAPVVRRNGNAVNVEWPRRAIDYVLEGARDLNSANWQFINGTVETNGMDCRVRLPVSEASRFFRLRKP